MLRVVLWVILGLLLFFLVITLVQFYFSVHPPKMGEKSKPEDVGLETYEEVSFLNSDGLRLHGWFVPSANPKSTAGIVVGHGYPFSKSDVLGWASFLHEEYHLLYFDFRYFGESEGKYTTIGHRERDDVSAAAAYMASRLEVDALQIGALGFSMSASAMLTSNASFSAIVADSPYAHLDLMIERVYHMFPGFVKKPFVWMTKVWARLFLGLDTSDSPLENIKYIDVPVLLVHGAEDTQIPHEHTLLLYEASNKSLTKSWIIPDADHGQSKATWPETYEKTILAFFEKHLSS